MANRFGQLVDTTQSGGLNVCEFWLCLLVFNERMWQKSPDFVLTDEEMQALIRKAFPTRTWSKGLTAVVRWRASYNRGGLLHGSKPKEPSRRYTRVVSSVVRWEPGIRRSAWPTKPSRGLSKLVGVEHVVSGIPPEAV